MILFLLLILALPLFSLPSGLNIISGSVSQTSDITTMQLFVSGPAILEWSDFSIAEGESVQFVQADATSAVMNRVTGSAMSQINGSLQSNEALYLLNPQGLFIAQSGSISCGAFYASGLDVANDAFLAGGDLHFTGNATAPLIHLGTATSSNGNLFFLGHQVENRSILTALSGAVGLLAGHDIVLHPSQAPTVNTDSSLPAEGIGNYGAIEALNVYLVSDRPSGSAIRQSHNITLVEEGGELILQSSGGIILVDYGTILSAPAGAISVQIASFIASQRAYLFGTLDTSGSSGGTISVIADDVTHSGPLKADGSSASAGFISIQANRSLFGTTLSSTSASSPANGGTVKLYGSTLLTSGNHSASSGIIHVLGNEISLISSNIDASGLASGGTILVGGDTNGANPNIPNALTVFIAPTTVLMANGASSGGEIVIWSEAATENYGTLMSLGSIRGLVDVSGHGVIVQKGTIDL